MRPEIRDMIKKLPKRGLPIQVVPKDSVIVNLESLNKKLADNSEITPKILVENELVKMRGGENLHQSKFSARER